MWNTYETDVNHPWICLFHMCYWNFPCENICVSHLFSHGKFHMWNFTCEIVRCNKSHGKFSHVTIPMWKSHIWIFPCEISHVTFPMWNFTCGISHIFTYDFSHVKYHMWKVTCEISRERSHVKFHMWYFTCEIPHVKFHRWNHIWNWSHGKVFPMRFLKSDSKCCRIRTCRTNSSRNYVWVKLYVWNLLWSNVENIFVSDWNDTIVRLQSHAVKRLLMYCFNS